MSSTNLLEKKTSDSGCSQFLRQFRVLAWKNATLKVRNYPTLIIEIIVPVIIILALGFVKLAIPAEPVPVNYPSNYRSTSTFNDLYTFNAPSCRDNNLVISCLQQSGCNKDKNYIDKCQNRMIAIAPSAPSNVAAVEAAQSFVNFAYNMSSNAYRLVVSMFSTF